MICFLQQIGAWIILMRSLNIRLPINEARYIYSLSFLARYIPGTIWGYLSRSEWLWQKYQVGYMTSNYGSILEVALSVSTGFFLIGFCIAIHPFFVPRWIGYILMILVFMPWLVWFSKISSPIKNKLAGYFDIEPHQFMPHFQEWMVVVFLLLLNWFYYGIGVFLVGLSIGIWQISQFPSVWIILTGDFSAAWLAGFFAIFIPSGLGVRELAMSVLLANQFHLATGVPQSISVMMRLITVLAEFVTILLTSFLYYAFKRSKLRSGE
jgi:glycosyltransferase 2 family protein